MIEFYNSSVKQLLNGDCMNILFLEDDDALADVVYEFLSDNGFNVTLVKSGYEALNIGYEREFDLFLFDVRVPEIDGFTILKRLREQKQTPAIFLTSLNMIKDLEQGFLVGCQDYIKKPFELEELLLRVKNAIKSSYKEEKIKISDNLYFDVSLDRLFLDNLEVDLHQKELKVLKLLLKNRKKVVTLEQFYSTVWDYEEVYSNESLRVYIKNLRKIFGQDMIENIKGVGYRLKIFL